jgi:2-C-methyl-D-erythritol 4-phosphate cytidylyltransferase
MQSVLPKQFLELAGKPILLHTLEKFFGFNPEINIVVVMHPDFIPFWSDLARTLYCEIPHKVIPGGEERFHSVQIGLQQIADEEGIVGIHDAVRPLVSIKTLELAYTKAREHGSAIPVLPLNDSLREVTDKVSHIVDRTKFRLVQTPQCFRIKALREAFELDYHISFTDDAAVWEASGREVYLFEGNRANFKITTPEDLRLAEAWLMAK